MNKSRHVLEPTQNTSFEKKKGGGKLKFKGSRRNEGPSSSSTKKRRYESTELEENNDQVNCSVTEAPGSGRIVTSGTTVHGFETKFKEEIGIGDVIILLHPKQLEDEERIVVSILSQRCVSINEQFSSDVSSTTAYRIRKDSILLAAAAADKIPEDETGDLSNEKHEKLIQDELSKQLQKKLKKSRPLLTYREKTGMWGYKVVTEKVNKNLTAEDLLDLRSKKQGRDKYCW